MQTQFNEKANVQLQDMYPGPAAQRNDPRIGTPCFRETPNMASQAAKHNLKVPLGQILTPWIHLILCIGLWYWAPTILMLLFSSDLSGDEHTLRVRLMKFGLWLIPIGLGGGEYLRRNRAERSQSLSSSSEPWADRIEQLSCNHRLSYVVVAFVVWIRQLMTLLKAILSQWLSLVGYDSTASPGEVYSQIMANFTGDTINLDPEQDFKAIGAGPVQTTVQTFVEDNEWNMSGWREKT